MIVILNKMKLPDDHCLRNNRYIYWDPEYKIWYQYNPLIRNWLPENI